MRLLRGFGLLRVTMAAISLLLVVKTAALVQVAAASVPAAAKSTSPAPPAIAQSAAAPLPSGGACPSAPSAAELALLGDLKSRKAGLDQRAANIAARARALAAAE